jgi:tubby-related protein 1
LGTEYIFKSLYESDVGDVKFSHYVKSGGPRCINVILHGSSDQRLFFENIKPVWHEDITAHVLHFDKNRIKEKSVKNFKLCQTGISDENKHESTVLQFGRIKDRNEFILDFSYPLTPLQAFSIALASIDCRL